MSSFNVVLILVGLAAVGIIIYRVAVASRFYVKYRGERLIQCPENHQPAAVRVAAGPLAVKSVAGKPHLRLQDCSRWPEKEGCGQDCLSQVEADPQSCLVWNVVNDWYAGKNCAICAKPFGHINWHDHRPALLDEQRRTVQWTEVPPEQLHDYFESHRPVCWDCHVAEKFRREHGELVSDRLPH